MVKLIVGSRGTGKTKQLIDLVETAEKTTKGNVVCIEKGEALKFDLTHKIRLIDIEEYEIAGEDAYYGFIAGLLAGNYDITEVFCDATYRIICGADKCPTSLESFIKRVSNLGKENNVTITFTVSADVEDIPESIRGLIA